MSTRGCVAIGTKESWRGLYNHYDSYPTNLGAKVWTTLQESIKKGETVASFGKRLLDFDDWCAFLNGGICEFCGKKTTQPHSIKGTIIGWGKDEREEWKRMDPDRKPPPSISENLLKTGGYPDPDAKFHKHEPADKIRESHITCEQPDPLSIEWVYVIDAKANALHVFAHKSVPMKREHEPTDPKRLSDGSWDYGHCRYKHVLVTSIPLDGPEPKWSELDDDDD